MDDDNGFIPKILYAICLIVAITGIVVCFSNKGLGFGIIIFAAIAWLVVVSRNVEVS